MDTTPLELSFEPVDNDRLANLCGVLDENLRQVENALDVSIARRGERFRISGEPTQQQQAAEVLRRFYGRAHDSHSIEDIQLGQIYDLQ